MNNYSNYCKVCKYMRRHSAFTNRLLHSQYYDKEAPETLPDVIRAFDVQINMQTIYSCLKKHHSNLLTRPSTRVDAKGNIIIDNRMKATETIIEQPVGMVTNHELGLDDFIEQGRTLLANKKIAITANTYLQAIKIKADIEKNTKDRRMDLLKSMFAGAAPVQAPKETNGQ